MTQTNPWTFISVQDSFANTQVTGIDNTTGRIVGVHFNGSSNPTYDGFIADQVVSSGVVAYPSFRPEPPNTQSDDVYLSSINDTKSSGDSVNSWVVGFSPPIPSYGCTGNTVCGLLYQPNNSSHLSALQAPGSCGQTYLYGTSDTRIQVGYYTKHSKGCEPQAFEEYNNACSSPFINCGIQFVDIQPPSSSASMAYGINTIGDVVGTSTTSSGAASWRYRYLLYTPVQAFGDSTQAFSINFAGDVAGSYQGSASDPGTHGFAQTGDGKQEYSVDEGPGTVVNFINDYGDIVGWHGDSGSEKTLHGFVGLCPNACALGSGSGGDYSRKVRSTSKRGVRSASHP